MFYFFLFFTPHLQLRQYLINEFNLHPGIFVDVIVIRERFSYIFLQ